MPGCKTGIRCEARLKGLAESTRHDEARKRVIPIAAAILAAREPSEYDGGGHVPATIYDHEFRAEHILKEIDQRWPATD